MNKLPSAKYLLFAALVLVVVAEQTMAANLQWVGLLRKFQVFGWVELLISVLFVNVDLCSVFTSVFNWLLTIDGLQIKN